MVSLRCSSSHRCGSGHLVVSVTIVAISMLISSCRGDTPERQEPAQTGQQGAPSGPLTVEWTDAELEKSAARIGYGSKPDAILTRSTDGALVFTPQTPEDHVATEFTPLQTFSGDRSLELIVDASSPGGEACVANLQDQAYNVLATVPCRTAGEQRATAKVPNSVKGVRVYFMSSAREPLRLPTRMQLIEHR